MSRLTPILVLLAAVGASCSREGPIRIASKPAAENRIVAEMFAALAAEAGIPVQRRIPYGTTFELQEAIKDGRIDAYPEYTGTGVATMGLPAIRDPARALEAVRSAFAPFGLQWSRPLGFDNSYVLVMLRDTAARLGIDGTADLVDHGASTRMTFHEEFRLRPVDGYAALLRHHGWRELPEPLVEDDLGAVYRNLVAEEARVAVVNRTDPQIEDFDLVLLADDRDFFPVYEAAPLVRAEVLRSFPAFRDALEELAGRLDGETMRGLNRRVELDGHDPRDVAVDHLVSEGLIDRQPPRLVERTVAVASAPAGHRSAALVRALDAVRRAVPNRRVELVEVAEPQDALVAGRAFLALLGAEEFFRVRPGALPSRREDVEAVAPVGHRMVHLLAREPSPTSDPFAGIERLGIGPAGGGAAHVAEILADAYGVGGELRPIPGATRDQAREVESGSLDALLLMVATGDAQPVILLKETDLELRPITAWGRMDRQFRYPFLRPATIGAGTYPRQDEPVATVSAQLVLAGPSPPPSALGDGDPVSGLRVERRALPRSIKLELVDALGATEGIDPTLPGENVKWVRSRREEVPLNPTPASSVLNAVVLVALLLFVRLLVRRPRAPGREG